MSDNEQKLNQTRGENDQIQMSSMIPQDDLAVSNHTITLEGRLIKYSVTCGTMVLRRKTRRIKRVNSQSCINPRHRSSSSHISETM